MGEKILYDVLRSIGTGKEYKIAPNYEYVKSLERIGLITIGWVNIKMTPFGDTLLNSLKNIIGECT